MVHQILKISPLVSSLFVSELMQMKYCQNSELVSQVLNQKLSLICQ